MESGDTNNIGAHDFGLCTACGTRRVIRLVQFLCSECGIPTWRCQRHAQADRLRFCSKSCASKAKIRINGPSKHCRHCNRIIGGPRRLTASFCDERCAMASRRTSIQCAWPGCLTSVLVLKTAVVKSTAKGSAGFSYQIAGFNRTYYSRHPICEEHIRRLVNAFGGKVRVQYLFRLFAHAASEWPSRSLNSRLSRFMLFDRAAGLCQQCTRPLRFDAPPKTWQIDHVIPIFKGGKTTLDNLP